MQGKIVKTTTAKAQSSDDSQEHLRFEELFGVECEE